MEKPYLASQIDDLEARYQAGQEKIAKLEQKLEAQAYEMQQQGGRIQNLEQELAEAHTQLNRVVQVETQFERLKTELLHLVERQYSGSPPSAADPTRTLANQLDTHAKTLNNLLREVDKTHRYEEQIALARTEVERLNKTVSTFQPQLDTLKKQLDERGQDVAYFEDQRRADTRQLTELQAELPDLHKKIAANLSKIQLVEQQIPQFGKYEIAIEELRNEIRRSRESTDFQIAERERQMKKWADLAESQEERIEEYKELIEKHTEHYQLNKRTLASLQDFQERLQRDQHQTHELQRLTEERLWAAVQRWQVEYEQRWKKQSIEWQPKITDVLKTNEQLQQQIEQVKKFNQNFEQQLDMIFQIIEADVQARTLAANDWQRRFEELASEEE